MTARSPTGTEWDGGSRLEFLQPDTTVLHLTAVALQADGGGWWNLEGGLQDLPIAGAEGDVVGGNDFNLIPILRFIVLEFLIPESGVNCASC